MPLITTYASASKRGIDGNAFIPELTFSVSVGTAVVPANGVRIQFITPSDGSIFVDWGNGTTNNFTANTNQTFTKTYTASGTYTIKMTGKGAIKVVDAARVSELNAWGSDFYWTDCSNAFKNASNLRAGNSGGIYSVDGYPRFANLLSCSGMFDGCINYTSDMSKWDTSLVTDMSFMFRGCSQYFRTLGGVNNWDVSNVTNMESMFDGCGWFGYYYSDIDWVWNTSKVTNMRYMFANMFAGWDSRLIWDTSNVTDMTGMFYNGVWTPYNATGGICDWDTSKVTNMSYMFYRNRFFNSNISSWSTSNVTNMSYMFGSTDSTVPHNFNQPIGSWNTSKVTDMSGMFTSGYFNQNINTWDVSKVTNMSSMFDGGYTFNQPLNNWNTASVTNMSNMFKVARNFNQPLETFNTSKVTNMQSMFQGAEKFNQPLAMWDVSKVTNMTNMFSYSTSTNANMTYNQDLSDWCVTLITTKPAGFDTNYTANNWTLPKPAWGTCPPRTFLGMVTVPHASAPDPYTVRFTAYGTPFQTFTVSWGDGTTDFNFIDSSGTALCSHVYASTAASYIVSVPNEVNGIAWQQSSLAKIKRWGTTPYTIMKFQSDILTTVDSPTPPLIAEGANLQNGFLSNVLTGGVGLYNWNIPQNVNMVQMFGYLPVFNWDLSSWCVPYNPTQPDFFDINSPAWTKSRPLWGTCAGVGPLVYYDFSNPTSYSGTGTSVTDLTGNGYTGTLSNVTFSNAAGGDASGSLGFAGSGSINMGNITQLVPSNSQAVTVQVWVKVTNAFAQQAIFCKRSGSSEGYNLGIDPFGQRFITLQFAYDGGGTGANGPAAAINSNTWYFMTFTMKLGSFYKVYVNGGIQISGTPPAGSIDDTSPLKIGFSDIGQPNLTGRVGAVWGYNRELTSTEITNLFNSTKARYGY